MGGDGAESSFNRDYNDLLKVMENMSESLLPFKNIREGMTAEEVEASVGYPLESFGFGISSGLYKIMLGYQILILWGEEYRVSHVFFGEIGGEVYVSLLE